MKINVDFIARPEIFGHRGGRMSLVWPGSSTIAPALPLPGSRAIRSKLMPRGVWRLVPDPRPARGSAWRCVAPETLGRCTPHPEEPE